MPRQRKPKTRRHLCKARVERLRFPKAGIIGKPFKEYDIVTCNTADVTKPGRKPRRQPAMKNNTTSRCIRMRSANVLAAAIAKSKLLGSKGLAGSAQG